MSSDYFDRLNFAFSYWQMKSLNSNARLTYLAILYKWNAFRRPTTFQISDRELQLLTGLSSNAVTSSKRMLKNLGLIAFKATKASTVYSLPNVRLNADLNARSNAPPSAEKTHRALFTATKNSNPKEERKKRAGAKEDFENVEFDG